MMIDAWWLLVVGLVLLLVALAAFERTTAMYKAVVQLSVNGILFPIIGNSYLLFPYTASKCCCNQNCGYNNKCYCPVVFLSFSLCIQGLPEASKPFPVWLHKLLFRTDVFASTHCRGGWGIYIVLVVKFCKPMLINWFVSSSFWPRKIPEKEWFTDFLNHSLEAVCWPATEPNGRSVDVL